MIGSHSDIELVGLRLLGPGLLGGAYLRLTEGVTVLYGKNGALVTDPWVGWPVLP
jgi:hypothetical protein